MNYSPNDILIEKYRLGNLIGESPFTKIYTVNDTSTGVLQAVKILPCNAPGLSRDQYSEYSRRFQNEMYWSTQLEHPNIVRAYDFKKNGDDLLLVMEYESKGSLEGILRSAKGNRPIFPVKVATRIILEVSNGLAELHNLGAVHRNLKPSNILFDGKGSAKLADVGASQSSTNPHHRLQPNDRNQLLPGVIAYISPEQENEVTVLRPSSDVYSLGVILFELLTGRIYKNLRPGTQASSLRPEVPQQLSDLLSKMLSNKPEDRPWNGSEVYQDLNAILTKPAPVHDSDTHPVQKSPVVVLQPSGLLLEEISVLSQKKMWGELVRKAMGFLVDEKVSEDARPLLRQTVVDGFFRHDTTMFKNQDFSDVLEKIDAQLPNTRYRSDLLWLRGALNTFHSAFRETNCWDAALKDLSEAMRLAPTQAVYPYYRGYFYYVASNAKHPLGDMDAAAADFDKAIQLDPSRPMYYAWRGTCYRSKQDFDKALTLFNKSIYLDPTHEYLYSNRGWVYMDKQDFDAAIADFEKAIQIDPENPLFYDYCAIANRGKGDYDSAITYINKGISLDPLDAVRYMLRSTSYRYKGDYNAAIADCEKALELGLDKALGWYHRGLAYYGIENNDAAVADFSQVIQTNPQNADAYCYRARCYMKQQDYNRAIADYEVAFQFYAEQPNPQADHDDRGAFGLCYCLRGNQYLEQSDLARAKSDYDRSIQISPSESSLYFRRALYFFRTNDYEQAISDLNMAIQLDPEVNNYYIHRGLSYVGQKKYSLAEADFTKAINSEPNNSSVYYYRAMLLMNRDDLNSALTDMNLCIQMAPDKADYYAFRANIYLKMGDEDRFLADAHLARNLGYQFE